jgi:hypothetical protein
MMRSARCANSFLVYIRWFKRWRRYDDIEKVASTYRLRENVTTFFTNKISIFVSFRIDVAVATICTGVHLVLGQEREYKGESIFRMFQDGESVPVSVNKVWHLPVGQHGHILRKQDHRPRPVQDPRSRDHNAGM